MEDAKPQDEGESARSRILEAAAELLSQGGPDAATTRAVAAAAGVQAPTLYRLFGDKRGLLSAVVAHVMGRYYADKAARPPHADALEDLREGWDAHIGFSLAHPGLALVMQQEGSPDFQAAQASGGEVLRRRLERLAREGRLRVSVERAVSLVRAMGTGVTTTLLQTPVAERDAGLSSAAREAVIAAIVSDTVLPGEAGAASAAATLKASLDGTQTLSQGERMLLGELLARIANGG